MIDDDEEYDEDDDDEEDFGETELDRNAGDYGRLEAMPQDDADDDDAPATVAVDTFVPPVGASPAREDELPKTAPLVQQPRAIAKTAPLLPAQQPPGWTPHDEADEAVTALDREVIDPARPPRSMPAGARDQVASHPRQPAPPLPVPSSDLGLKLALAGLVALIVLLIVVLAIGVISSSTDAEQDDTHEGVRP